MPLLPAGRNHNLLNSRNKLSHRASIALPSFFHRDRDTDPCLYLLQRRKGTAMFVHSVATDRSGIPLKDEKSGRIGTEDDSD